MFKKISPVVLGLLLGANHGLAITLDTSDASSITSAAKTIADKIVSLYNGTAYGQTPGLFPLPYYWWESGLAWDTLINYWAQTGDDSYNDIINQALTWQTGPVQDFLPLNQTKSIGNDDQNTWALAAMTAAELSFPAPEGGNHTWIQLAENVFNEQVLRWDQSTCGGGLRWQIFTFNAGYDYKNALANGNFYQLASRLALYTGNTTYSDWAEKVLSWTTEVGLLDEQTGAVFDGAETPDCDSLNKIQFSASTGSYLSGAAYLQNYTANTEDLRVPALLFNNFVDTFTQDSVLYESACESNRICNTDQLAFKAIASRALARARDLTTITNVVVNSTASSTLQEQIDSIIRASARNAAAQCSGGNSGSDCGTSWLNGTYDGSLGLGQELSALEIIVALLPGKELRTANSSASAGASNSTATRTNSSTAGTTASGSAVATSTSNSAAGMAGSVMSLALAAGLAVLCVS